jgi:hypothetical protein
MQPEIGITASLSFSHANVYHDVDYGDEGSHQKQAKSLDEEV